MYMRWGEIERQMIARDREKWKGTAKTYLRYEELFIYEKKIEFSFV